MNETTLRAQLDECKHVADDEAKERIVRAQCGVRQEGGAGDIGDGWEGGHYGGLGGAGPRDAQGNV